jgi:recombination protein RecT
MQSAELGLEAGSALGHAYLVPYKTECTLIIGYRGLLELARRSGQIKQLSAHPVYEHDAFEVRFGTSETIDHHPLLAGERGEIIAAYAVAHLADGSVQSEVMTRAEIDAIRSRSRAGQSGPWVTDYAEMSRKTVLRRLCKYLPASTTIARALEVEDHGTADDVPVQLAPGASDRLRAAVSVRAAMTEGTSEEGSEEASEEASEEGNTSPAPEREPGEDG